MKRIKRIMAMLCMFVVCFTIATPTAHAQGAITGQQFGAWIASALVSMNCIGQILGGGFQQGIDAFHVLQQNLGYPTLQQTIEQLPTPVEVYSFDDAAVSEALNTSIIKIRKGVTTIDGVKYDELWVSPEGAQKLKTNAFDFITKFNLLSNDTSVLARGVGTIDGIQVFRLGDGSIRSVQFDVGGEGTYKAGLGQITFYEVSGKLRARGTWGSTGEDYSLNYGTTEPHFFYVSSPSTSSGLMNSGQMRIGTYYSGTAGGGTSAEIVQNDPFEYLFTNGEIPAEEIIPDNYGLSIKIPHEQLENFYNVYPQYNVDNSVINVQQDQIDINELTNAIFDYVESMQDIKAEWSDGEQPEPVDPIENIDDNVQTISEYQKTIENAVSHMHQDIEAMHETQIQQQQTQQQIQQSAQNADSTLKDIDSTLKDSLSPGQIEPKKFDLKSLFPFCIPFDIANLLKKFDAEPVAPHVQLPFVIQSIGFNYMLDLDFSEFDSVAQVMRTVELIVYCIGLAWATSKVIKW